MKRSMIAAATVLLCFATARADSVLYGTQGRGGDLSTLYTVNPTTGATTLVGDVGFAINSLEYHNGRLYGIERAGGSLISINTATGAGTAIGPLGVTLTSFAIDSTGNAFGTEGQASSWDDLHSINLTTGGTTLVGTLGFNPQNAAAHGMAFLGDTLYLYNHTRNVWTINTATAASTLVGNTGTGLHGLHGDVNPDDGFYYGLDRSDSFMHVTDLTVANELSSVLLDRQLFALAFADTAPIPEPGTLALFGVTALGAYVILRRRQAS